MSYQVSDADIRQEVVWLVQSKSDENQFLGVIGSQLHYGTIGNAVLYPRQQDAEADALWAKGVATPAVICVGARTTSPAALGMRKRGRPAGRR